jgi:hypothetical protein
VASGNGVLSAKRQKPGAALAISSTSGLGIADTAFPVGSNIALALAHGAFLNLTQAMELAHLQVHEVGACPDINCSATKS